MDKVEDVEVDGGSQVVNVGEEDVLLALFDELIEKTRVLEGLIEVTVTWRVPAFEVVVLNVLGDWKVGFLVNSWVSGLTESVDRDIDVGVLTEKLVGVIVGVERVHQDQWNADSIRTVKELDLLKSQIQESEIVADGDDRLWTFATHGGTQSTIQLNDHQLVKNFTDIFIHRELKHKI